MNSSPGIRILEPDNNKRGDLFGRLMGDLFVALGYENPRLNVHKSGREIDLTASHRLEQRQAVAECKATATPIGGGDVNKFVGALDAEHKKKVPITGYFISLSGFTETAIEQERQGRRTRIIFLNGKRVVEELVEGRTLISWARATELAGRFCANHDHLILDPTGELLAHSRGWIWAVYYVNGKARTHFALIHSDGTPLARALADEVIAADKECEGSLHAMTCLNPRTASEGHSDPAVLDAYKKYLATECGFIQIDGLPADGDVGSRQLRLENLFVPLKLDVTTPKGQIERQGVGKVLEVHPRLAILAPPGGGKSTLLKRLAIAYIDPKRREAIRDALPKQEWLPLFFRCRELRDLARGSFADLIKYLSKREGLRQHSASFRAIVDCVLLTGNALLLVDGLDEISDPGDRAAFVSTLRSAIQAYPGTALVVTSREAGFRHVAAHLAPICTQATLSPFDRADIRRLCRSWHREVVGDTEKVQFDADQLTGSIFKTDRIRRLAVNPLLLTTLLLVKRWVGSLPTKRAVLYGKAVEVLLMTWNTEGHAPIPEDEALPQLCFVASFMMLDGVQKISRPRLALILQAARDALPTELGYVQETVEDFIHRIEDRSSLLMMTGHDVEDGRLVEFFEFRHLTFQEFLTARAVVKGWHPGRADNDTLVSVLEPHFKEEKWYEVVPLAAVLGGKETEALIRRLTDLMRSIDADKPLPEPVISRFLSTRHTYSHLLASCLADEAAARPETVRGAIRELVRRWGEWDPYQATNLLARGKFAPDFLAEARHSFFSLTTQLSSNAAGALAMVLWHQTVESSNLPDLQNAESRFENLLAGSTSRERCEGALGLMQLYFVLHGEKASEVLNESDGTALRLAEMLNSPEVTEVFTAAWAIAWMGECVIWTPPVELDLLGRLFELGWSHTDPEVRQRAVWALSNQPLVSRDDPPRLPNVTPLQLNDAFSTYESADVVGQLALLVVSWYKRAPWNDTELSEKLKVFQERPERNSRVNGSQTFAELCRRLGIEIENSPDDAVEESPDNIVGEFPF